VPEILVAPALAQLLQLPRLPQVASMTRNELQLSITEVQRIAAAIATQRVLPPGEQRLLDVLIRRFPDAITESDLSKSLHDGEDSTKLRGNRRAEVARVRKTLNDFFNSDGRNWPGKRLRIPTGTPYRVELVENRPDLDPVEWFWYPHFNPRVENLIVSTEPLFFFDPERRCYIRFLDINDESRSPDTEAIRLRIPEGHPARGLEPCFHYQSSGETQAQRILRKWFEEQNWNLSVEASREVSDANAWAHNLILLGNSTTNRFIRKLQDDLDIVLHADSISVGKSRGSTKKYYDQRTSSRSSATSSIYAVVTRRPSLGNQRWATLIASNNGRAIERMAEYLTKPSELQALYNSLNVKPPLPARFQLLFSFKIVDRDTVAGEPELVESFIDLPKNRNPISDSTSAAET
jgi:hypothetical protein